MSYARMRGWSIIIYLTLAWILAHFSPAITVAVSSMIFILLIAVAILAFMPNKRMRP